jgi:hypothetical protein
MRKSVCGEEATADRKLKSLPRGSFWVAKKFSTARARSLS